MQELVLLGVLILIGLFLAVFIFLGWIATRKPKIARSPYTSLPVRKAKSLPYETKKKIAVYMQGMHEFDNRPFRLDKAVFDRETGRVFTDCIDWRGRILLDWNFLQERHPGTWVSWGSLSSELKEQIRNRHEDLEGFQMEHCSKEPSPRAVEARYAYARPGPLYADISSGVLMGWKVVPETEIEVLIVQNPVR